MLDPNTVHRSCRYSCGLGYSVEFHLVGNQLGATWSPRMPQGRDSRRTLERYRRGRDAFLADVSRAHGLRVAVMEMPQ